MVRHVQFADAPGRREPGTGGVEFDSLLRIVKSPKYDGWLSAEYTPLGETTAGLEWLKAWR